MVFVKSMLPSGLRLRAMTGSSLVIAALCQGADGATTPAARTEELTVVGHVRSKAGRNSALGSRSIVDTPFSISEVTAEKIKTLQAATINDVFQYDSSVKLTNSGVASGNTFRVRGLPLDKTNGYKIDGLPFPYWFQDQPLDHYQSVQLLKGVGGFLYGFASPGGILNFVSKAPLDRWRISADAGVRSGNIVSQNVDIGGPLIHGPADLRTRLDVEHEEGYLYNSAYNEEHSASLALAGTITPGLTWSINSLYVRTLQKGQVNSIALNAAEGVITHLPAVNGKLNLGSAGSLKTNINPVVTPALDWKISENWHATLTYRWAMLDERFPGNTVTIANNRGDYTNYAFNMNRYFAYNLGQGMVEGKFATGALRHDVVAGANITDIRFDLFNPLPPVPLGRGNIYSYAPAAPINANAAGYAYDHQKVRYQLYQTIRQNSVFLSDTATWRKLSILAGFRLNDYEERDYVAASSRQAASYNLHPVTPSFAAIYALSPHANVYFSYAEALSTGIQAPATGVSNPSAYLAPYTSQQYEFGLKGSYGPLNGSLAAFRITEPVGLYGAVLPGQTLPVYTLAGDARFQGVEFNASLRATSALTVSASASWLDATYTSGTTLLNGRVVSTTGKRIPGTSPWLATLFAEYRVPAVAGLALNGGVEYIAPGYGDSLQLLKFTDSTVFNIGASYRREVYGKTLTLRGTVANLLNRDYWAYSQSQVSAAPPRNYSLSVAVDF